MKITTAGNNKYASADIDYQPSLCFQVVAEEFEFSKKNEIEKDKSTFEKIERSISLFIDMLEIVNIHHHSSANCFSKAIEGLISGMAADIGVFYYDDYNEDAPLGEQLTYLKKLIYLDKENMIKNNFYLEEGQS